MVHRELSELEGVPNLWKTYTYYDNEICTIYKGIGFGGYLDWEYRDFDAKISIRHDHANDFESFEVGTYVLCICCGERISSELYCRRYDTESEICSECGTSCAETWSVHDIDGNIIQVCRNFRDENYRRCRECGEYYSFDDMTSVGDDDYVCQDCRNAVEYTIEKVYEMVADFEEITPKKLPQKYEDLYEEWLEFHTAKELEQYREEYGEQILHQLYIDEYGTFYAAQDRRRI